jgi:hypothetical protein
MPNSKPLENAESDEPKRSSRKVSVDRAVGPAAHIGRGTEGSANDETTGY